MANDVMSKNLNDVTEIHVYMHAWTPSVYTVMTQYCKIVDSEKLAWVLLVPRALW